MRPPHKTAETKKGTDATPTKLSTKSVALTKAERSRVENLVAGILLNNGRFLVEKRRLDKGADPGYIEIPGGHVEPGETLEEALKREMMEELGIAVEKARMFRKALTTATNGEKGRIHYFHIQNWRGRIQSHEAERVYWESDISNLSILPDRRAIRKLLGPQWTPL